MVSHADAVYNLSRAALLATAFCEERYDFLPVAAKDSLHQQYRLPLIEGGEAVFALADGLGALATFISGAGPTILPLCARPRRTCFLSARRRRWRATRSWRILHCTASWRTTRGQRSSERPSR